MRWSLKLPDPNLIEHVSGGSKEAFQQRNELEVVFGGIADAKISRIYSFQISEGDIEMLIKLREATQIIGICSISIRFYN